MRLERTEKAVAMLQIDPDKVCFIIAKARRFDAQEAPPQEDGGKGDTREDFRSVLLAYPDDPTYDELASFIDGLNEEEQTALVALAWVGREDYTADEWEQALQSAADRHTGSTAKYLLGIPLLPDYLEGALTQFGHSCVE